MRLTLILLCLLSLSNAYRKVLDKLIFLNDHLLIFKQQEQPTPTPTPLLEDEYDEYDDNTPLVADDDPLLEMSVGARQNNAGQDGQHAALITDENR